MNASVQIYIHVFKDYNNMQLLFSTTYLKKMILFTRNIYVYILYGCDYFVYNIAKYYRYIIYSYIVLEDVVLLV